jgi:hypothetical protein
VPSRPRRDAGTVRRHALLALGLGLSAVLGSGARAQTPTTQGWPRPSNAQQSVSHLHLLRQAPFFTGLDDDHLRWILDHSREWKVVAGEEISTSNQGADSFWVLLDGGWEIESGTRRLQSGPAEAAKWYGGAEFHALDRPSRLVATGPGYVINLRWSEVEKLRKQAPTIERHLDIGLARYRSFLE